MAVKAAISVLLFAAILPVLFDAFRIAPILWQNAPGRLAAINTFKSYEHKFANTTRSCEDGLVIESKGLAILSCDPGREKWNTVMGVSIPGPNAGAEIYAYDYKDANAPDSDSLKRFEILGYEPGSDLHTLGMEFDEDTSTLFVANHRSNGPAIEMFKLDFDGLIAHHFRTIRHPLLHGPNSLALINDHELLVTNDHHFLALKNPILAKMETHLNLPLGTVVHVDISPILKDPTSSVAAKVVAYIAFPNGIEILNSTTVAVASTIKTAVYLYDLVRPDVSSSSSSSLSSSSPTLKYKSTIRLPFMVDNLQASSDGALFAAGHPYPLTLEKFSKTRYLCNSPADLAAADADARAYCETGSSASWVSKWTEARGVEHLYAGAEFPTSSTAAFDTRRNVGIVTGLYAKGILVWRE